METITCLGEVYFRYKKDGGYSKPERAIVCDSKYVIHWTNFNPKPTAGHIYLSGGGEWVCKFDPVTFQRLFTPKGLIKDWCDQ
jgi:hypothetical protein